MDEILELAAKLGKQIAADPRAERMSNAREALEKSAADRQLLGDYEDQQRKMMEMETQGKPIEPADKHRLAELHQKVVSSEIIKDLVKAQADYLELMTLVSQRVEQEALGMADRR